MDLYLIYDCHLCRLLVIILFFQDLYFIFEIGYSFKNKFIFSLGIAYLKIIYTFIAISLFYVDSFLTFIPVVSWQKSIQAITAPSSTVTSPHKIIWQWWLCLSIV